jgi:hypothetical protein
MILTAGKATMHDERAETPQPQLERAPWIQPEFSRLMAGSAEFLTGPTDDGADLS